MTIKIKLIAHASIQIQTDNQNIYIDPSTKYAAKDAFKPADFIFVTHEHADHFDKGLIKKIRALGSPVVAPNSVKKKLGKIICWDMDPGQHMDVSGSKGKLHAWAVPAYNIKRFRSPGTPFHPKGDGAGFILEVSGKKIYHAGDTDLIPEMEKLPELDVALLPAGDTYTMDLKEAAEAALLIKPKVVIPMHLKGADPKAFKEEVESKSSTKVVILNEGEEYTLE
ncbi:MAG: MBL fold metallo-hydrolase [Candidatus Hodarchaeota archaeon]